MRTRTGTRMEMINRLMGGPRRRPLSLTARTLIGHNIRPFKVRKLTLPAKCRASLISKPDHVFHFTGTADSTVPSPLPQDGVKERPQYALEDDPNPNDPYRQDVDLLSIPQTMIYPGREPSPEQLAHLLSGLVEQEQNFSTPPPVDIPSNNDRDLVGSAVSVVSDLISTSPSDAGSTSSRSSRKSLKVKVPALERRGEDFCARKLEVDQKPDQALTEAIKGVYKLWKAER